jgi:hypothetical protein
LSGVGTGQASAFELMFQSGAVGLGGAASEVFHVEGGHATMVAQVRRLRRMRQYAASILRGASAPRLLKAAHLHVSRGWLATLSGASGGPFLRKAFAAENGAALCGAEGNSCLLAALRAGGSSFDTRITAPVAARRRSGGEDGHALGLADLAALGLVLELFVEEEELFPGSKDKVRAAVDAGQYLILKFH